MIIKSENGGFFAYVKCPNCGIDHGRFNAATMTEAKKTEALLIKSPICLDCISHSVASNLTGMMYANPNFKTKKALKEAVRAGKTVTIFQPGLFGGKPPEEGIVTVEGPYYPTWDATILLKNGKVVKVQ